MSAPAPEPPGGRPAYASRAVGRWLVRAERTVYASPWVTVGLADVTTPGGRRVPEHHVVRVPLQAAGALVHDADADALLLIWRHRFITDSWGLELPAGRCEPGEAPSEAAARECEEETGWRPEGLRLLASWHPSNGLIDQTFSVFGADAARKGSRTDHDEAASVLWLPVAEVERAVDAGEVRDGLTLTGLLAFLRARGVAGRE